MSAIRIQVKDEYHNLASYAQLPLNLITTGPIEIVGPNTVVTEGGMTGTYIKTTGEEGDACSYNFYSEIAAQLQFILQFQRKHKL